MTKQYSQTPAVATGIVAGSTSYPEAIGASPKIQFFSGTMPADAGTALSSNTKLAELTCAATPISGSTDTGTLIRAAFAAIASAVAIATGTCAFYRTVSNNGATTYDQGTVGITSDFDLTLSTVGFTAGSTISVSSRTLDYPYK